MLELDCKVSIASDGIALELLKKEFPELEFYKLPAYNVRYKFNNMALSIAAQLPKIAFAIYKEHHELNKIIHFCKAEAVISDSRFGAYSNLLPCIFISHQLNIKTPSPITTKLVNWVNHCFISKFNECWIPDLQGNINLAGDLSHNIGKLNGKYIGLISRIKKKAKLEQVDIAIILSGPEPQRTILEKELLAQIKFYPQLNIVLVRGLPSEQKLNFQSNKFTCYNYLTSVEIENLMNNADFIVSRSGYSTLLDLVALDKKALLIPTPGQTEQIYLAQRLTEHKYFISQEQGKIKLSDAFEKAVHLESFSSNFNYSKHNLSQFLKTWLNTIS